ncbi:MULTISPECIES: hypothetical protein [unclassified Rhizobium]|uniref:hypothetical protein n=1 Tax=unclassified Rhizobium TaxID=2613769 RepID=UPI0027D3BC6C|nr:MULTISPECIES: hypothetical protein [unclassified Rhizobium]MDQ4407024.1 hypothetical protein [Rhizobium sp. AN63]
MKPQIDSSSIDAAQAKTDALKATLSRWGVSNRGNTGAVGDPATPISGARARGGPVSGGKSYLVGEQGPEIFTPGRSGGITPNHALDSGGGIVVHAPIQLTFNGSSAADVKRAATEAAQTLVATLTSGLDQKLNREAQTSFSNVNYGEA